MFHPTIRTLMGGLKTSVLPMNGSDYIHHGALTASLQDLVEHEAKAHDAVFDHNKFKKIIHAVEAGKIQAWFIMAGWEHCLLRVVGAAIEFPTVFTEWDGNGFKHYAGVYGEDTCIQPKTLRGLIKDRPYNKVFPPDTSLGLYFEQERMRLMRSKDSLFYGKAPKGRVGEFSAHSHKMISLLKDMGSELGDEAEDPILEMNGLPQQMRNRLPVDVEVQSLASDPFSMLSHAFVVNWSSLDGKQQLAASFTDALSTFTGDPIVRIQLTSNGNLPYGEKLKEVLSSVFMAGEGEVRERQWGRPTHKLRLRPPSPLMHLHAPTKEALQSMFVSCKDEFFYSPLGLEPEPFMGGFTPTMRIHAIGEKEVIKTLKELGLETRKLGPHIMQPVALDLDRIAPDPMELDPPKPEPFKIIRPMTMAGIPLFSIAA